MQRAWAWPWTCVLCGARVEIGAAADQAQRFCRDCLASLPRLPEARCAICALPLPSGTVCGECNRDPPAWDAVAAAFAYHFPVDALIRRYKYGGDLTLAPVLARALHPHIHDDADLLIAMPLAPPRLSSRGFNQAHEIARHLARWSRIPLLAHAVRKLGDTAPQAALPWRERARNVRGAFVCEAVVSGLHVALVDDVMTTGATANELARNLKRAGAARVSVWVVARTLRARC